MAVLLQTLDGGLGLYFEASGHVSMKEFFQTYEIPREVLQKARYCLVSFTHVESMKLSGEEITQMVEQDQSNVITNPQLVQAIIAPKDLPFGLSRVYSSLSDSDGWPTGVFRDRETAEVWIKNETNSDLSFHPDHPPKESWG